MIGLKILFMFNRKSLNSIHFYLWLVLEYGSVHFRKQLFAVKVHFLLKSIRLLMKPNRFKSYIHNPLNNAKGLTEIF